MACRSDIPRDRRHGVSFPGGDGLFAIQTREKTRLDQFFASPYVPLSSRTDTPCSVPTISEVTPGHPCCFAVRSAPRRRNSFPSCRSLRPRSSPSPTGTACDAWSFSISTGHPATAVTSQSGKESHETPGSFSTECVRNLVSERLLLRLPPRLILRSLVPDLVFLSSLRLGMGSACSTVTASAAMVVGGGGPGVSLGSLGVFIGRKLS